MADEPSPEPAESESSADVTSAEQLMQQAFGDAQSAISQIDRLTGTGAAAAVVDDKSVNSIELLSDVDLHVMIELGRTEMLVEDVLKLGFGSVVELDKLAGDPVDVYVNHRLIARGEVLVLNDNFCVRISEIVDNLEEQAQAVAE